ncbi:MAG TPA: carboxypeptidase-like regulatory domain-containing protein [Thermoanaerobaculia bacterium]|jgi:hypothetical protein|nr:carboxypeptidase-like regulatory domain-containing protein [Thermoanaerobaculia bacterium]
MANRREALDRLRTSFECDAAWEEMAGDGCRRHCAACRRDVLDFAQLAPRAIRAHLQASGGRMCARLTRRDGRLVVAPAIEPASAAPGERRRAPVLAATLVTAWLTASAGAQPEPSAQAMGPAVRDADERQPATPPPARSNAAAATASPTARATAGATLFGRLAEESGPLPGAMVTARNTLDRREHVAMTGYDGGFVFDDLPSGVYDVEAVLGGFAIEQRTGIALQAGERRETNLTAKSIGDIVTAGAIVQVAEPLRSAFEQSALVVVAVAGPSTVLAHDSFMAQVVTQLRVETVLKGAPEIRRAGYRHAEYAHSDPEIVATRALAPGTRVLAFLVRDGEDSGDADVYEAVDFDGIRRLDGAELTAYLRRLEALIRLDNRAARLGESDPADIVEWLVGTVENPYTRGEAVGELANALGSIDEQATKSGTSVAAVAADLLDALDRFHAEGGRLSPEPPSMLLGAFVGEIERQRLTDALLATTGFSQGDRDLFELVRRWDQAAALDWLAPQLDGSLRPEDEDGVYWWLVNLADEIDHPVVRATVDAVVARVQEIEDLWPDDESEETQALRAEKVKVAQPDLRHELAAALATPR